MQPLLQTAFKSIKADGCCCHATDVLGDQSADMVTKAAAGKAVQQSRACSAGQSLPDMWQFLKESRSRSMSGWHAVCINHSSLKTKRLQGKGASETGTGHFKA